MLNQITKVFFLLILIVLGFSAFTYASPVLIKVDLTTAKDYQVVKDLKGVAYQRWENSFLVEMEKGDLSSLENYGITYEIIDETPWTDDYYIVSPKKKVLAKEFFLDYGEIILEKENWKIIETNFENASQIPSLGYEIAKIFHTPIPLEPLPLPTGQIEGFSYSPETDSLVSQISLDSLRYYVQRLQDFQTRYSFSDSIRKSVQWIYSKFVQFNVSQVDSHYFDLNGYAQYNIPAIVIGTANPDKVIVVGGHHDSVVYGDWPEYNPYVWAPGADDNGSGTATALEMARIIAAHPLRCTVIFCPFAAEEQGLYGSYYYAADLSYNQTPVQLMFNYDMIGYNPNPLNKYVNLSYNSDGAPYAVIMSSMASLYTSLIPRFAGGLQGNTDSWPFHQWGYRALSCEEGIFNTQGWHTNTDIIDNMSISYMTEVVKMGLATLIEASKYPVVIEGLKVVDAGDGKRLYISWNQDRLDNDLSYYRIYYGIHSGAYDSVRISTDTTFTLDSLQNGTTYYFAVTAVNTLGKESLFRNELSGTPRSVPLPPVGLNAAPGVFKISLSWSPNKEADIGYYNIYREENSSGNFVLLHSQLYDTAYIDSTVVGGIEYGYELTAVDTSGNESAKSIEVKCFPITMDQGILLVDETENIFIPEILQDSFYADILRNYNTHIFDCGMNDQCLGISLGLIGQYSTVVWIDEDLTNHFLSNYLPSGLDILKTYLGLGGNLLLVNWGGQPVLDANNSANPPFHSGQFAYDYLYLSSAKRSMGAIKGAKKSLLIDYPDLMVDTTKLSGDLAWGIPDVYILNLLAGAEPLYLFETYNGDTTFQGKTCGVRYLGSDYKFIYLAFPLYFSYTDQAKQLIGKAMSDFNEPTGVEQPEKELIPSQFSLSQNYPNPFNPVTNISYYLEKSTNVKLCIYNILGEKVKVLVDEWQTKGLRRVNWDGKDENGKTVASGIYFYKITTPEFSQTKKMVLLK